MKRWMIIYYRKKDNKKNDQKKGRRGENDSICDQCTNACKLGANWDHQIYFLNHASLSQ